MQNLVKTKTRTTPSKPEDGFDTKIAQEGRDKSYELGKSDYKKYIDFDDLTVQTKFKKVFEDYIKQSCHSTNDNNQRVWYINNFKKGYESSVNAPIRK